MTGADLVTAALALHPALPTLVITGYADDAKLGDMPAHVQVVHKPFHSGVLVRRLCGMIGTKLVPPVADLVADPLAD